MSSHLIALIDQKGLGIWSSLDKLLIMGLISIRDR